MPISVVPGTIVWVPTPVQIHALIPVRPEFSGTSKPTVVEVQAIIDMQRDVIDAESLAVFPDEYAGKVRYIIALGAASQIEESYFPEQNTGPDSPGQLLYARYLQELAGLRSLPKVTAGGGAFTIVPFAAADVTPWAFW